MLIQSKKLIFVFLLLCLPLSTAAANSCADLWGELSDCLAQGVTDPCDLGDVAAIFGDLFDENCIPIVLYF